MSNYLWWRVFMTLTSFIDTFFNSQPNLIIGEVTTSAVAIALRDYLSDHATTEQLEALDAYISANVNTLNPIPAQMVMVLAANEMIYNNTSERKAA